MSTWDTDNLSPVTQVHLRGSGYQEVINRWTDAFDVWAHPSRINRCLCYHGIIGKWRCGENMQAISQHDTSTGGSNTHHSNGNRGY